MRKAQLALAVRNLLPPDTLWSKNQDDTRLEDGETVLILVARVSDPQLAVKLIDFVCPHSANFWARNSWGRHVIMDVCYRGVHPSVLLRLIKWARKCSLNVIAPMSRLDSNGLDAMELAIRGGHGALASCLLNNYDPTSHYNSFCNHYPLEVLELAIESKNEQCIQKVLANKRVVRHLQPGMTARLNLSMRWMQRQNSDKRLFNVFTSVRAAVRCNLPEIVQAIYKINPKETRQAVWYAVHKLKSLAPVRVSPELRRMANSYLLDKIWPQVSAIMLLQHWEMLAEKQHGLSLWQRVRHPRRRRDWNTIASSPWAILPSELLSWILSFLLPCETSEAKQIAILVEY